MSNKVRLPKETAESLEFCLSRSTKEQIIKTHREEQRLPRVLNELDFDQLVQAIYIGYEVEQTPEDKVREYYNENIYGSTSSNEVKRTTIRKTLELLNIKISGVNAE